MSLPTVYIVVGIMASVSYANAAFAYIYFLELMMRGHLFYIFFFGGRERETAAGDEWFLRPFFY